MEEHQRSGTLSQPAASTPIPQHDITPAAALVQALKTKAQIQDRLESNNWDWKVAFREISAKEANKLVQPGAPQVPLGTFPPLPTETAGPSFGKDFNEWVEDSRALFGPHRPFDLSKDGAKVFLVGLFFYAQSFL